MSIPAGASVCSRPAIVRLILGRKLTWVGRAYDERGYLSVRIDIDEIRVKVRAAPTIAG